MSPFFDELKRRNVFRVVVAYVVTSWLVLQVADVVIGNIGAPPWVFSIFLLALTLGFFPAVFISWAYELTPDGLKKESEVDRTSSITPETAKKLDVITIIMLVAVVAFVLIERTMFSAPETTTAATAVPTVETTEEITATAVNDQSIAVLAFEDLSQEGDQEFFAEGLSEELLNVLAQVPDLKVAGRTSSFAFKGKDADLREIGEVLNVAHILEGSVRKAGNRIRVTAQLIKASDGFHLFSETYDRDLNDIFAVQDELAGLISDSLRMELTGEDAIPNVTPTELAAYDQYLIARQRIRTRVPEMIEEALDLLDKALEIDPDYAPALAQRALAVHLLSDAIGAYGEIPEAEARPESLRLVARALELDPELAEAHAVRGLLQINVAGAEEDARADLEKALQINPGLEDAKNWLASVAESSEEQTALYEDIILHDPLYGPAFNNLIQQYTGTGNLDKADALISRVERISGYTDDVAQARGTINAMRGELAASLLDLKVAFDTNPNNSVVQLWYGYALLFAGDLETAVTSGRPAVAITAHLKLGNPDEAQRIIDSLDFFHGDRSRRLRHTADFLVSQGRPEDLIAKIDELYGGTAGLFETLDMHGSWGAEYLGSVAYAYLLTGDDAEFENVMDEFSSVLDQALADGFDNWYHWYSRAQFHALRGDQATAVEHLQRAFDGGMNMAFFFEPVFDLLDGDEGFVSLTRQMQARVNESRAEIGLGPYVPVIQ